MSATATIQFEDFASETSDGWREFHVSHSGGLHRLQMCYATKYSCPCRIKINNRDVWVSVVTSTTPTNDGPYWFLDEGIFDLGDCDDEKTLSSSANTGDAVVAFRPVSGKIFPTIQAFRFTPIGDEFARVRGRGIGGYPFGKELEEQEDLTKDLSLRWRTAPTAVTFSFEIGMPLDVLKKEGDVEYFETYLPEKAIKFRFGEAHDSVSIDGEPFGSQHGGERYPKVSFLEEDDFIQSATIGLSTYTGEGAFTALTIENRGSGNNKRKRPLVGAVLAEPSWTYDCRRLGLNLWITLLAASKQKPVARYGFTLSSDGSLDFQPKEFHCFWDWLVKIKSIMMGRKKDIESIRSVMEPQKLFLLQSFSGNRPPTTKSLLSSPSPPEGYLYGTLRHVSITFDVFSIRILRLPDGETFHSTIFVDGKQYNTKKSRMEEIRLKRNDVLAFAISLALQDKDLLFEMGLIKPINRHSQEEQELDEVETLPLKTGVAPFSGDYNNTVMARRVVTLLALAGLRKVSYETIMATKDGWDIYDFAAGAYCSDGKYSRKLAMELGALCCGFIQIIVPIFLIHRSMRQEMHDIAFDVYLSRFFFGCYFVFYEAKTWEVDNGDRVTGWLCFLPEFNTGRLIVGLTVNKISRISVSVAIIALIIRSRTVFDVTLNALALYFLVDVDDYLVDDRTLEEQIVFQRRELFILKSKTALEYQLPTFDDADLPSLKNLPARYFRIASNNVSTITIIILILGCLWMVVEPWVLGWDIHAA